MWFQRGTHRQLFSQSTWWAMTLAVVLILVRVWPFWWRGDTLVFGDNYSLMVPGKLYTVFWLKQGVLPLWNPLIFAGLPWLADINQSVLYFTTAFFYFFHPATALNLTIISHWLLAFFGAFVLGKHWTSKWWLGMVAGSLWMLSTQVTGSSNNFSTLQSLVWLPLIAYCGLKLQESWWWSGALAGTIAVQFFGGYPQHVLYAILAAFWLAVVWEIKNRSTVKQPPHLTAQWYRNWLGRWLVAGLLTLGFAAGVWVPFVELLRHSTRMEQTSTQAAVGSLDPLMLAVKPLLPYGFDKPTAGMKWGPAWSGQPNVVFYLGWVGLALLVVRWWRFRRFIDHWFFWPILLSLVIALGSNLPGFTWLQSHLAFLRIARYPSMIMIATQLWLIIWLVEVLHDRTVVAWVVRQTGKWWLVGLGVGVVGWAMSQVQFATSWQLLDTLLGHKLSLGGFHTLERDQVILQVISENLVVAAVFALATLWSVRRQAWGWVWLFISLDLIYATSGMLFFAPKAVYNNSPTALQLALQSRPQTWQQRFLTRNVNKPYADYGSYWEAMVVRAPFSDSFVDAGELQNYQHLKHLQLGQTPNWNMVSGVPLVHGYTTLLPQDYDALWRSGADPRINFIAPVEPTNPLLAAWAVEYYLVDTAYAVTEDLSALPLVATIDQWQLRQIPNALSRVRFDTNQPVMPRNWYEDPNTLKLSFTNTASAAALVVADRYDASWQATVNGQPVAIKNHQGMRQIPIEPGANVVVFSYHPDYVWWGLWVSLASFGGYLAVMAVVCLTKRRRFVTI